MKWISIFFALTSTTAIAVDLREIQYFDSKTVNDAIDNPRPLIETEKFRILMSNHKTPGEAEIHLKETDIIYCLEGEAEFVTGGKPLGVKETAPNELRGTSISGGTSRLIKGGDILVIPAGVPHWFKQIHKPFRYSVTKVSN